MLNNIKSIIAVAGIALLCGGCDKFLNTPPVGSLPSEGYYSTPAHIEQGVRGVYSGLINIEANQYMIFSEDRSDNTWGDPVVNGVRAFSEVAFLRFSSSLDELGTLWKNWYSVIYNANTVLSYIDGVTFESEDVKNQLKGELLFLRGYAFFELARTFGNVPLADHALSASEAKGTAQSTPEDVINNRVIPDLQEAESLLPYESGMKGTDGTSIGGEGRADKVVAEAMLARVYMTLKGFPFNDSSAKTQAASYLKKVLDYSSSNGDKYWAPTIEEWQKQWLTDYELSNKYQIFSIQHRVSAGNKMIFVEGVGLSGEYVAHGSTYCNGSTMNSVYPEATLRYEYVSNNDPRGLGCSFLDGYEAYGSTTAYSNTEFEVEYNGEMVTSYENSINTKFLPYAQKREALGVSFDDTSIDAATNSNGGGWPVNFPVLRLEDMMLLYAELLAEDGNVADALGYVNKIRNRAGVAPVPTSASSAEALNYIKRERKLELYLEGVRWFDQVRYGEWEETTTAKFDRYKVNGEYRQGVSTSNIVAGRHFLPIPYSEMSAVPGLYVQNTGWSD